MLRSLMTLVTALGLAGCYTFQPASPQELAPGQSVRVRITGAFSDSVGPLLMLDDARVLEGAVIERSASATLLEVPVSQGLQGMRFRTLNQRVEIPDAAFVDVETRQLSKGRTFIAAGGAVAIAAAIVVAQLNKDSGGGDIPGGGGPEESIVSMPGFSLTAVLGWITGH